MKALRKRVGWPRWRRLARSPAADEADGEGGEQERRCAAPAPGSAPSAEPGDQAEAEAREGGEGDDRGGGMHVRAARGVRSSQPRKPPASSGSGSRSGASGVDVALPRRQVLVGGPGALLRHEVDAAALGDEARDRARRGRRGRRSGARRPGRCGRRRGCGPPRAARGCRCGRTQSVHFFMVPAPGPSRGRRRGRPRRRGRSRCSRPR